MILDQRYKIIPEYQNVADVLTGKLQIQQLTLSDKNRYLYIPMFKVEKPLNELKQIIVIIWAVRTSVAICRVEHTNLRCTGAKAKKDTERAYCVARLHQ